MYESKDKMVSHPDHYQSNGGLEVIDVIKAFTADLQGPEAYLTGNIIKYACRWPKKNGIQDLEKLIWYAHYLIDHLKAKNQEPESVPEPVPEPVTYAILTPEKIFEEYTRRYGEYYNMKFVAYKPVPDELNTIYIWHDINSTDCYEFYYDGEKCSCVEGPELPYFETKKPEIYKPDKK